MAIAHSFYHTNLSPAAALRRLRDILTTTQPKAGRMWELVHSVDADPSNAGYAGPLCFILRKALVTTNEAYIYAKLVFKDRELFALVSSNYVPATDNDPDYKLTGCATNGMEEVTGGDVRTFDSAGVELAPSAVSVPRIILPTGFDPAVNRFAKVWFIRRLDPLFDEVDPRKNTDISAWMTVCTDEVGTSPLDTFGYFAHMGFGMAGEQLVPDTLLQHGPGLYMTAGSFADSAATVNATSSRTFAGGGMGVNNNGTLVCAGDYDTYRTWFYANTAYGQVRAPFDDDKIVGGRNVGFDFTEMCKYSPYSGVRVLTPAYIYGMYDNLFRILCRIPVFYTSLEGLYAGDTISQDVEGTLKSYKLFPLWKYRCLGDAEAKRGLAIFVPADENV